MIDNFTAYIHFSLPSLWKNGGRYDENLLMRIGGNVSSLLRAYLMKMNHVKKLFCVEC